MRLEFRAVEGGLEDEGAPAYCLVCGVYGQDASGAEHFLAFQRGFENEDPDDDWGVYFEFDDQINGAYNCVRRCRLTPATLEVELTGPIDWQKKYNGVVADLSGLDEKSLASLRAGLSRIFRGTKGIVELS